MRIERCSQITDAVIQIPGRFDLKTRKHLDHPAISLACFRANLPVSAMLGKKLKECCIAEILFQIGALTQVLSVNFRNRQSVPPKMPGKCDESLVLFAHIVQNPDCSRRPARQPDDPPARPSELALKRLHRFCRGVKMILKKFFQSV